MFDLSRGIRTLSIVALMLVAGCARPNPRKQLETQRIIRRFADATELLVISTHKLPEDDIHALIAKLRKEELLDDEWIRVNPGSENGTDSWGNELILEVHENRLVILRSKGPDGVDGHGGNDDIEVAVECDKYVRE